MLLNEEFDFLIRPLTAFLAGGLLSLSGSLIQGVTQNDLASPDTLGLNAFVVLLILVSHALTLFFPFLPSMELTAFILFLLVTPLIVILCYGRWKKKVRRNFLLLMRGAGPVPSLILLGLCFNLFVGAIFSALYFFFMTLNLRFPTQLWYGNFRYISDFMFVILCGYSVIIFIFSYKIAKKLRPLSFGADLAAGLGIDTQKIQLQSLLLALLALGIVNCFFGVFSFMGLIFPHLLRSYPIFGKNLTNEIIWGPFLCGSLFSLLDLGCLHWPLRGAEVPVGLMSALIGTFFLLAILLRGKGKQE